MAAKRHVRHVPQASNKKPFGSGGPPRHVRKTRSVHGRGGPPAPVAKGPPFGAGGPPKRRSAAGLIVRGEWITGYNDHAPTCVATAIANSLLAVTGIRVTDDDVLLLFLQSGGHGVSMAASLAALSQCGIGGHHPAACRLCEAPFRTGDIVGVGGIHAACQTDVGLVSWGDTIDPEWEPDGEAWRIDW